MRQTSYFLEKIRQAQKRGASPEVIRQLHKEVEDGFDAWEAYADEHYSYEEMAIDLPKEFVVAIRDELIKIIEEKGTGEGVLTGRGKRILLDWKGKKMEVWHPGEDYPVQIHVLEPGTQVGSNICLGPNASVFTSINVYDDVPSTKLELEETKNFKPYFWQQFLKEVIEKARQL